ncbi:MAG: glycosyltransferase family 9 protein [Desulfovermiculus sp.]
MPITLYREKWNQLRKEQQPSPEVLTRLSRQIAHSFLDTYLKDCRYQEEYITLLCEMTTHFQDHHLNIPGSQALFGIIIESLCDDFEELQTITYNQVMSQIITFCRQLPAGQRLDQQLREFGITTQEHLLRRMQRIRETSRHVTKDQEIRKVLILSRVTIGADVAVTSIILQHVQESFPQAEIVLIGQDKLQEIYGSHPDLILRKVPYSRNGGLLERLSSWHEVLDIIRDETRDTPQDNTILFDPDSRLSQLGVLPLFPEQNYFFFDSRSDKSLASQLSMSELVNAWLSKCLGRNLFCYPRVWLPKESQSQARNIIHKLRHAGAQRIVVVNFGYGGNPRKRVGPSFEAHMLLALLLEPSTVVILDRGFGPEEAANTEALLQSVKKHGYVVQENKFSQAAQCSPLSWGILALETRMDEIGSLIANSDEFIGYDSACQHMAAALETPCITIFAGSNNMRFIRRWSAFSRNSSHIVHADTLNHPLGVDDQDIVTRAMHLRRALD